jgi:hypothetical protein
MPAITAKTKWLGTDQAAKFLALHPKTLQRWRRGCYGPPFHRKDRRNFRYLLSELREWKESRKVA